MPRKTPQLWRKLPERPLGEVLERKLKRRQRAGSIPAEVVEAKRSKIRQKKG